MGALLLIIIIICLLVAAYISAYNKMGRLATEVDESWSQIDVQLKRRNDLIPNLVNTVKGSAKFESDTLAKIAKLRNAINVIPDSSKNSKEIMDKSNELSACLRGLFVVSENYPDLKSNEQFNNLTEELTNTENKIAYARQLYNSTVANYNEALVTFPTASFAKKQGYTKRDYLVVPASEKQVPKVEF